MQRVIHHLAIFTFLVWGHSAIGQLAPDQYVWIQVEAQPDRKSAMNRIKAYSTRISNVVGFEIEGGWFGIALGPYKSHMADALLKEFKEAGLIPPDSFVARGVTYGSQFYTPRTSSPQLIAEQSLNQAEIETTTQVATEMASATETATGVELESESESSFASQGHPWACAHWRTARCPFSAANVHVPKSQGHPWARAHCSTARFPCHAA